jgi:hypothetical protein
MLMMVSVQVSSPTPMLTMHHNLDLVVYRDTRMHIVVVVLGGIMFLSTVGMYQTYAVVPS